MGYLVSVVVHFYFARCFWLGSRRLCGRLRVFLAWSWFLASVWSGRFNMAALTYRDLILVRIRHFRFLLWLASMVGSLVFFMVFGNLSASWGCIELLDTCTSGFGLCDGLCSLLARFHITPFLPFRR